MDNYCRIHKIVRRENRGRLIGWPIPACSDVLVPIVYKQLSAGGKGKQIIRMEHSCLSP